MKPIRKNAISGWETVRNSCVALSRVIIFVTSPALVAANDDADLGNDWSPGPPIYGTVSVPDVQILMDDGITLVGDVVYPSDRYGSSRASGAFPVLLNQTPYQCGLSAQNLNTAIKGFDWDYFVRRGYILASICVRGTGRSEGTFDIWSPRSARDGVQLVNWAAHKLEGSDGTVGLIGCSYHGAMQSITASSLSPGSPVKAMAPFCTGAEAYRVTFFSGGMPTQTFNWLLAAGASMGPEAGVETRKLAAEIMSGGNRAYDRQFWESRTPGANPHRIARNEIPALFWTGYADEVVITGTMEFVAALQNAYFGRDVNAPMKVGQPGTGRYQVIVGPWGHNEGIDLATQLKWYDTWLKKKSTGMADVSDPFHMWLLGRKTWIDAKSYPMVPTYTSYYLNGTESLTNEAPKEGGIAHVKYAQPDQAGGKLRFTSRPLKKGAIFAGPGAASIWVSSTGTNAQIIATIQDVAPDGTATTITKGSLVASLRELEQGRSWFDESGALIRPYSSFDADRYLTPDIPVRLDIPLDPRMAEIAPGHAIRLEITTQTPVEKCVQGLGTDPCFATKPQRASLPGTYSIHSRHQMASVVRLPLAALDAFTSTTPAWQ